MAKDFSGLNLIGESFKGQDLTGANFSGADIRGVNFKRASLVNVNFSNAKAGLRGVSKGVSVFLFMIFSAISGFMSILSGFWFVYIINNTLFKEIIKYQLKYTQIILISLTFSMFFLIIMVIVIRQGKFWAWAVVVAGALAVTLAVAFAGALAGGWAFAGALAGAVGWAFAGALALALAWALAWAGAVGWSVAWSVAGALALAGSGSWSGSWAGAVAGGAVAGSWSVAGAVAVVAVSVLLLSYYIFWRTFKEDEQFAFLRKIGLIFATFGGTDFRGADLTEANFSGAFLKGSRFNKDTIIKRTCWRGVEEIEWALLSGTILENRDVRELLVTGKVKDRNKSFVGINLKGAHLVNVDLHDIDFTEADISNANLENTSLKNANLTKIQALGVEFKRAVLTGACLEAWNIDSTTRLQGAHADYVYLLRNKEERRPSSGIFREGEFSILFQEVLNTIDFIFKNGIDWKAFVISFDKLKESIRVESEGTDITVQSIENKGNGVFVVRVNMPDDIDKAEVHRSFKQEYDRLEMMIEEKYQEKLESKEREVTIYREQNTYLNKIIFSFAQRPFQIKTEANIMNKEKYEIKTRDIITGSSSTVNLGEISGTVNNIIEQLSLSISPDQQRLKELLIKLQAIIEDADEKELRLVEKMDALEEIKTLATIGQQSNPDEKQVSSLRRSLKFFKGLIADLPMVSNLAKELGILISAISSIFKV